jgi:hypothetical protein
MGFFRQLYSAIKRVPSQESKVLPSTLTGA